MNELNEAQCQPNLARPEWKDDEEEEEREYSAHMRRKFATCSGIREAYRPLEEQLHSAMQ